MRFEPKRHLIKVQGGRSYLPISARLIWFRNDHPDWCIETESVALDLERQYAIFRARISNADGRLMAVATKCEDVNGFPDYIEKAETGAIGRALALCGYGTQFATELDLSGVRGVDSVDDIDPVVGSGVRPTDQGLDATARRSGSGVSVPRTVQSAEPLSPARSPTDLMDSPPTCASCSKSITRSQQELSLHRFGDPLCPACQKERSRATTSEIGASAHGAIVN